MSTTFTRTFHALTADGARRPAAGIALAGALVGAWTVWASVATVNLYETSDRARVEADQAPTEVQSDLVGRVVSSRLAIGGEVRSGDVLVALDAEAQRLELARARSTAAGLGPRKSAVLAQMAAERRARDREREASAAQEAEGRTGIHRAEAAAEFASNEAARTNALRAQRLASVSDSERAATSAQQARGDVDAQRLAIVRLEREQKTRETDRSAAIASLESTVRDLEAQEAVATADIARLQHEVDRREIRAPIDGRIADAEPLAPGAVVTEGERLCVIVPAGKLRIVARFTPAVAGRIRAGQVARVHLQGFPWTQFGSVNARVARVASEPRDSTLRVELAVVGPIPAGVPLQHGLPGSVDVLVGRLTPARLVLRELGGLITTPVSTAGYAP